MTGTGCIKGIWRSDFFLQRLSIQLSVFSPNLYLRIQKRQIPLISASFGGYAVVCTVNFKFLDPVLLLDVKQPNTIKRKTFLNLSQQSKLLSLSGSLASSGLGVSGEMFHSSCSCLSLIALGSFKVGEEGEGSRRQEEKPFSFNIHCQQFYLGSQMPFVMAGVQVLTLLVGHFNGCFGVPFARTSA